MKENFYSASYSRYGFSLFLFILVSFVAMSDGTKQLKKVITEKNCIQLYDRSEERGTYRVFATYEADSNQRLCFSIKNFTQEVILFGFNFNTYDDTVYFRIKDKTGNVVFNPVAALNRGQGFINSYNEVTAGPLESTYTPANTGGYKPFVFKPEYNGDYYIEFNIGDPEIPVAEEKKLKHIFTFFDLSVIDITTHTSINGRVWSKAWDFTTQGEEDVFTAKLYIYSDDGVITQIDFNGMKPWGFVFSCNETGTRSSGNFYENRQSVNGDSTYPQYKVFLTYPDPDVFVPGELNLITRVSSITCAEHGFCVNAVASTSGSVSVVLEFNGVAGYQQDSEDVALNVFAPAAGTYCIPWDGLNGKKDTVRYGEKIIAVVNYQKGLTNLPIYDVEGNPNGYIVTMLAPEKKVLELHWDNSLVGGSVNLTGCYPDTLSGKGCLGWGKNSTDVVRTSTIEPLNFGNDRTYNAWWYAASQNDTFQIGLPFPIVAFISSDNPTKSPDTARFCPSTAVTIYDRYSSQNSEYNYQWVVEGKPSFNGKSLVLVNITEDTHISLIVENPANGCSAKDTYFLDLQKLFVPNLITPNGDDKNDRFEIGEIPPNTHIDIFNRWGDLIYKNDNYQNEWGGESTSSVYYYQIIAQGNCGEYKGWLDVIH